MNQSIATTQAPRRYGKTIVSVSVIVTAALAIGVAIGSIVERGDNRQAVAPRAAPAPAAILPTRTCASDLLNLAATINAMGSDAGQRTVALLTPELAADLLIQPARDLAVPTPDTVTLAQVMGRLSLENYLAVMGGLSADQQQAIDPATATQCSGS